MAFNHKNLSVLAYANGFTFWCYHSEQGEDPRAPDYFERAHDKVQVNDLILLVRERSAVWVTGVESGKVVTAEWLTLDVLLGPEPSPDEMAELEEQFNREFSEGIGQ